MPIFTQPHERQLPTYTEPNSTGAECNCSRDAAAVLRAHISGTADCPIHVPEVPTAEAPALNSDHLTESLMAKLGLTPTEGDAS